MKGDNRASSLQYDGVTITSDGDTIKEIKEKLNKDSRTTGTMKSIFASKHTLRNIKEKFTEQ